MPILVALLATILAAVPPSLEQNWAALETHMSQATREKIQGLVRKTIATVVDDTYSEGRLRTIVGDGIGRCGAEETATLVRARSWMAMDDEIGTVFAEKRQLDAALWKLRNALTDQKQTAAKNHAADKWLVTRHTPLLRLEYTALIAPLPESAGERAFLADAIEERLKNQDANIEAMIDRKGALYTDRWAVVTQPIWECVGRKSQAR